MKKLIKKIGQGWFFLSVVPWSIVVSNILQFFNVSFDIIIPCQIVALVIQFVSLIIWFKIINKKL